MYCALSEWRKGVHEVQRFDGEVYKHLYYLFLEHMERIKKQENTPGRMALSELQKRIAKEGL